MSLRLIVTWSWIGSTLKTLPPWLSSMASRRVTRAPRATRRMARLLPRKPSPPVISTCLYRAGSSRGMHLSGWRGRQGDGRLHDLPHHELRRLVLCEEEPAEVLAEQAQYHELHAREEHHGHDHRSPADREAGPHQALHQCLEPQAEPKHATRQPHHRAHPEWHHREVHEHVEPEAEQLPRRVVGAPLAPW